MHAVLAYSDDCAGIKTKPNKIKTTTTTNHQHAWCAKLLIEFQQTDPLTACASSYA